MMELRCGCRLLHQACVISPRCTAGHSEQNRPGGPALPTPKQTQKRQEARDSGRKLKPGRWKLDPASGTVHQDGPTSDENAREGGPAPGSAIPSPAEIGRAHV